MSNKFAVVLLVLMIGLRAGAADWSIDTQSQWTDAVETHQDFEIKDGLATPTAETTTFKSRIQRFQQKRSATSIVFEQSPI